VLKGLGLELFMVKWYRVGSRDF